MPQHRKLWLALACAAGCTTDHAGANREGYADARADADVPREHRDAGLDGSAEPADAAELEPIPGDAARPAPEPFPPQTPAELAVRSAQHYDDNQSGLVSTARLLAWLSDWQNARPESIDGDLVIMQLNPASAPLRFLQGAVSKQAGSADTSRVRVYDAPDLATLLEPRSNGITALGAVPATGTRVDTWLRKYKIRPRHDLLLLAAGELSDGQFEGLARAWLSLRYWGFAHASLAVYNHSIESSIPPAQRRELADAPSFDGEERVSSLPNHFALLADLGAVRASIGRDTLIDARTAAEYAGDALGSSLTDNSCRLGAPNCTPLFSGRIAGAIHIGWESLFTPEFGLRPRDELEHLLTQATIPRDKTTFVYDNDREHSASVVFALLAVTGVPARWYAPGFFEWGSLSAHHSEPELRMLPAESPWKTDVFPDLTQGNHAWSDVETSVRPLILDAAPRSTERVQATDLLYKQNPPPLPGLSSGENGCM